MIGKSSQRKSTLHEQLKHFSNVCFVEADKAVWPIKAVWFDIFF